MTRGYDPRRLQRALLLKCDPHPTEPHVYYVSGSDEPYYQVNLNIPDAACPCADAQYRGSTMCKHELCARVHDGDHRLIYAMGQMLVVKQTNREQAGLE